MKITELKSKLFQKIDQLNQEELEEAYGVLINFLNSKDSTEEWDKLSEAQREGIIYGLEQLDNGHSIAHEDVIEKYRKKYNG